MDGNSGRRRRKDGGRWPEATRSVNRHSPRTWRRAFSRQRRRAFVLEGHSLLSRAKWRLRKGWRRTARVRTNGSAQTCDLRYFGTPTSLGADSASFPAHHSWVLSLRANRLLDRTKFSQRDRGRDRREGSAAAPNRNRYSREARNYRIKDAQCRYSAIAATCRFFGGRL